MKMKDFLPTSEELIMMGPKEKNVLLEKLKYVQSKIDKEQFGTKEYFIDKIQTGFISPADAFT